MKKKVLVVLGNPRKKSFCGALANAYLEGASEVADVKELNLGDLKFDPNLKDGYTKIQPLESDLRKAQNLIKWADHIVVVYPTWWGSMPALMQGFFDRTLLPGFGFKYDQKGDIFPKKLLKGKSAHVINTSNVSSLIYRLIGNPGHKALKTFILGFCGVKPIRFTTFGRVKYVSDSKRKSWIEKIKLKGKKLL